MGTQRLILFAFIIFALQACSVKNCDVDCTSPPLSYNFELVDKTTGENLFVNGTFDPNDIKVVDIDNENSAVEHGFISENNLDIITLGPFGWEKEVANYLIKVDTTDIFSLHVDAERISENCCTFTQLNEFGIEGAAYEQNSENGIYKILVEL